MSILIAYCIGMKKDHQTLLNFAILAGKRHKNAPFDIKSPLKIFMVGPKKGASHRGPPPKYATDTRLSMFRKSNHKK